MEYLGHGFRTKKGGVNVSSNELKGDEIGLNLNPLLVINLPSSWTLRIMSRSLLLAMILLALPSLLSITRGVSSGSSKFTSVSDSDTADGRKVLPILLRDLLDEGLIKKGHKGFLLGPGREDVQDDRFLRESGIHLLNGDDLQKEKADFVVFSTSFNRIHLVDELLKDSGLVISPLGNDPWTGLRLLRSYKIVYIRRFENTVVAMRKRGAALSYSPTTNVAVKEEMRKAILNKLEDAYLEPPRRKPLKKRPSFTSRKIKFLPNLLKDTLDEYPRRVFITDDCSAVDWFYKNYPMRDQEFEVYNLELGDGSPHETGLSSWMSKNVGSEDYVVMKAEAQVVEEMLNEKRLYLVDELFLECKNDWWNGGEGNINRTRRVYWQCLSLYGKVRDAGIAVHQWWN